MLVNLADDQYDWLLENAPFQIDSPFLEVATTPHCPDCGHLTASGHYPSCPTANPANVSTRIIDNCTCGTPGDSAFYHHYDGSPCTNLNRADL